MAAASVARHGMAKRSNFVTWDDTRFLLQGATEYKKLPVSWTASVLRTENLRNKQLEPPESWKLKASVSPLQFPPQSTEFLKKLVQVCV
jgi:hypothetical protein